MGYDYRWRPYVSAGQRRKRAADEIAELVKSGRVVRPVEIKGRTIATTFWGQSWCKNLEAYSDYSNRLPRGRTYARNGSVIDLQIETSRVRALVSGSRFYEVEIDVRQLSKERWDTIKTQCAGKIDSMVELLRGSISKGVMQIVTRHGEGLFPSPGEISLSCSCPDWATMCKHVAAALYGVGARLDHEPEMLFALRGVEPAEMIAAALTDVHTARRPGQRRILKADDVSSVFGIELDMEAAPDANVATRPARRPRKAPAKNARNATVVAARKKNVASATSTAKKTASAKSAGKKKSSTNKATGKKSGTAKARAAKRKAVDKTAG